MRRWGWRRSALAIFLLFAFGTGFYLAELYSEISTLIEQRRAALSSAVYSAPLVIEPGDRIEQLHLIDRLGHLSYTRVASVSQPGEYSLSPGAMTIYIRAFKEGMQDFPASLVHLTFDGGRVVGIGDAFGVAMKRGTLEPEVIGRLMADAPAERVELQLNELKPYLVRGLLATEDRFFYYHFGFDPIRIIEAAIVDLRSHHLSQGASTITQQLARTFIERHERSFRRKIRELAIAIVLEMRLSKNEILERYINDVPMGEYDGTPIYGMPLAARYFFNKDLREVTPDEAATLIGIIKAPSLYDPRRHPDACRARRDQVLEVMWRAGVIDQGTYLASKSASITVLKPPGLRRAPYFTDYVISQVEKIPGFNGNLKGIKVYTTLDPELQEVAGQSVTDNLNRLEHQYPRLRRSDKAKRLEGSLVAIDARTGAIRAMVGGRDYGASQFNRATSAERQTGSAFKPIVYLTALDPLRSPLMQPVTLASILPDRPMSFKGWAPVNYEGTYRGRATVAEALAESLNVPTAYLGSVLGAPTIVRTAHELGVHENLPDVLPISIGAGETTLLELTSVYQVFASAGVARPPYAIEAAVDGEAHLIFQHRSQQERLMSSAVAYLITGALEEVLNHGTAAAAGRMGLDFAAAGKTGTTDDYHDAYFVGYTSELACGVWVGFDRPQSIGLTGAQAALPAWIHFMVGSGQRGQSGFATPPGITMAAIDPETGGLATPACPHVWRLPFLSGTEPTQICPLHGGLMAPQPTTASAGLTMPLSSPTTGAPTGAGGAVPGAASNGVLGAIGNFFGSLFGN